MQVEFKRFDAELPAVRNNRPEGDAGWDLFALADESFEPYEIKRVPVNLAIALPGPAQVQVAGGCQMDLLPYGLVTGRSGMNAKGWLVYPGIIDAAYRGQIQVVLQNHTGEARTLQRGDRIAQLLFCPVIIPALQEVAELSATDRGGQGFGSSGG